MSEMDLFVRGLRLLHSKSKDSAEQLRQLLDDVIAQKCVGVSSRETTGKPALKQDTDVRLISSSVTKKQSPKHMADVRHEDPRRRDIEKRAFDKLKQDLTDFSSETKRSRLSSPYSSLSSSPSPQPIRPEDVGSKDVSEDSDDTEDAEDFAMKMGLACVVCRQLEISPRNQLIECQECHNLYHQECHRPAVTDSDVNDPRHVWYCAKCMKNMKKVVSKSQKVSKPSPVLAAKDTVSTTKVVSKPEVPLLSLLPFKRTEIKSSVSQGGFSGNNKPTGLASLAANLSSSSRTSSTSSSGKGLSSLAKAASTASPPQNAPKPMGLSALATAAAVLAKSSTSSGGGNGKAGLSLLSSSSSSGRSGSSGNGGNGSTKTAASSSLMSADKRLQIMKKKAAAKMQEKRRLSSK